MGQEHLDKAVGQNHQGKGKSIGTRMLGKGHPDMGVETWYIMTGTFGKGNWNKISGRKVLSMDSEAV